MSDWLDLSKVRRIVQAALEEDIGAGDITTALTVSADARARAHLIAREAGVLAGMPVAAMAFTLTDPEIRFEPKATDGDRFEEGQVLAIVSGPARGMLSAERVALNFLQRLSGIATRTARFVELVKGTNAKILDTRKTTPGLRVLEKYAVRVGGGHNHRFGLSDGVLIKDNHIAAAGGVTRAVAAAKAGAPHTLRVQVEVCDEIQLEEAIARGADAVLLEVDRMPQRQVFRAVARASGHVLVEASGGITEEWVRWVAETGVDFISVGALTHSVKAVDIALDFVQPDGVRHG